MTSRDIGQSIRELGELMEHFHDQPDELERLCSRTGERIRQMRALLAEQAERVAG